MVAAVVGCDSCGKTGEFTGKSSTARQSVKTSLNTVNIFTWNRRLIMRKVA